MECFIAIALISVATGGIGYYIGERGMTGVKIDLDNTRIELEKLKTRVAKKANA